MDVVRKTFAINISRYSDKKKESGKGEAKTVSFHVHSYRDSVPECVSAATIQSDNSRENKVLWHT